LRGLCLDILESLILEDDHAETDVAARDEQRDTGDADEGEHYGELDASV
jgi:hypothetical protein